MPSGLFSDPEENQSSFVDEDVDVRPVSKAAIFALVVSLLSFAVVISPLFGALTVAAVVLGLMGLYLTSPKREAPLGGRVCAVLGLSIALFLGGISYGRMLYRSYSLHQLAEANGTKWLELVLQGELEKAHQLKYYPANQASPLTNLKAFYRNNRPRRKEFDEFYAEPPLDVLVKYGKTGSIRHVKSMQTRKKGKEVFVRECYEFSYTDDAGKAQIEPLEIIFKRHEGTAGDPERFWKIENVIPSTENL